MSYVRDKNDIARGSDAGNNIVSSGSAAGGWKTAAMAPCGDCNCFLAAYADCADL